MATSFLTGLDDSVKPMIDGATDGYDGNRRYSLVNSRNANRKLYQSGSTVAAQLLGIEAPTVAPTGTAGTGNNLYYCYVYVNKKFRDLLASEADDYFIRSNPSPVLTIASVSTKATAITPTLSTDSQVTHIWLYVSDSVNGPFVRLSSGYEVANTGTPTWDGVTAVPADTYTLETDNFPVDTCRIVTEVGGFYLYGGFVPLATTASATVGSPDITGTGFPDGIKGLFLQFTGESSGGPNGNGLHLVNYVSATQLKAVNTDGTDRNYDGTGNKTNAACRIFRAANAVQISKKWNQDFTPAPVDPDFIIRGPGNLTGITKPVAGYAVSLHYNDGMRKTVHLADFTQGVPPRIFPTASSYAMANPRAYVNAGSRRFYYDRDAGIIEDRGMAHIPVTLSVIPNLIRSLNPASEDIAEMEYDESRNLVFLSCAPSGYEKAYYLIIYNLTTNTWNLWFMLPDVLTMRRFKDSNGNVVIKMGSSNGSITVWPSTGFNEAVGTSIYGNVASVDDATHLTALSSTFPTSGDKLKDRWIMVWDDSVECPTYQFARISDNTDSRLTLDTFIGPNSTTQLSPVPQIGWAYWVGPIQSILGPCWDFNSTPDDDGKVRDVSLTTNGLSEAQTPRIALYRNLDSEPMTGGKIPHTLYHDSSTDTYHQSIKLGNLIDVENTGVTGWKIIDDNEAALSIKAVVRRVKAVNEALNSAAMKGRAQ